MSKHVSLAAIMAVCLIGLGATAAYADVNVFVGYADNLRPSGFFPSPWLFDPGVVSQTPDGQSLDTGAIRIDNTGATAVTISNFKVSNFNDGTVYAIWNSLVIPAGDTGIFTQTGSFNFDSSDNSGNASPPGGIGALDPGGNGIGGCSSSASAQAGAGITGFCDARQPLVSFSLDGGMTILSLSDKGHILDTGNYDFINGSPDGNESINWNLIGSEASRSGTVPESSTWAMMLIGLAGLGLAGCRTSRKAASIAG